MASDVCKGMEVFEATSFRTMTRAEAIDTILRRAKSLERFLVHKNPASSVESTINGIENEPDEPEAALRAECERHRPRGISESEYDLETLVLRHRLIIALVNKELNNLFRYTLDMRLRILHEHHLEFQVDIKTAEEYLLLLRELNVADDKYLSQKIRIASELMAESSTMRNNIEARIQEVDDFLSETSDNLDLRIRKHMMSNLGVRHGVYGSTLTLRDHEKFPQWKHRELLDIQSLEEQSREWKVVSRKSGP
ncbi:hypothetical protein NHQ30_002593 [Ciborinia camelliae]|nr:hypothetical protein NHQ30_002593 [Ciborinia camelliae]